VTPTPDCCDVWTRLAPTLTWYVLDTPERLRVMPCMTDVSGSHVRVNYCPGCGAPRRQTVAREEAVCQDLT